VRKVKRVNTGTAIVVSVGLLVAAGVAYMVLNKPAPQVAQSPGNVLSAPAFMPQPPKPNVGQQITGAVATGVQAIQGAVGAFNQIKGAFGDLF
jgi:hypothetical protein